MAGFVCGLQYLAIKPIQAWPKGGFHGTPGTGPPPPPKSATDSVLQQSPGSIRSGGLTFLTISVINDHMHHTLHQRSGLKLHHTLIDALQTGRHCMAILPQVPISLSLVSNQTRNMTRERSLKNYVLYQK